jgi:hypothetical protein
MLNLTRIPPLRVLKPPAKIQSKFSATQMHNSFQTRNVPKGSLDFIVFRWILFCSSKALCISIATRGQCLAGGTAGARTQHHENSRYYERGKTFLVGDVDDILVSAYSHKRLYKRVTRKVRSITNTRLLNECNGLLPSHHSRELRARHTRSFSVEGPALYEDM